VITPDKAVSVISGLFGNPEKVRVLHAKGFVCRGSFVATPAAKQLTKAAHFQGPPVETTVRLSNGSGRPREKDYAPGVRGLAVAFDLPDGGRPVISSQTLPRFPVPSPDGFVALMRAVTPGIQQLWRLPAFLARYPKALGGIRANARYLAPTASYATSEYFAIHAYTWIADDGSRRSVRYHWKPQAGVQRLSSKDAKPLGPDYLQAEFEQRLSSAPVRFDLHVQVAGPGDDPDDPSSPWASAEDVHVGTLEITEAIPETGVLVFDPTAVVDGIELSGDPVLRFRADAYTASVNRRLT
jgi:catalase